MQSKTFNGDKKNGTSLLYGVEKKFLNFAVPKIPHWIETYHLTLLTLPMCFGVMLTLYLGKWNVHTLWLTSLLILAQYVTDILDGAVGRYRGTGLIKWGYYMDHMLDYIFLCSLLIGYAVLSGGETLYYQLFILVVAGAFMLNSHLFFAATGKLKYSYMKLGTSELRIVAVFANTMIIMFGKTHLTVLSPYVLGISLIGLTLVLFKEQKELWDIDMEAKKKSQEEDN